MYDKTKTYQNTFYIDRSLDKIINVSFAQLHTYLWYNYIYMYIYGKQAGNSLQLFSCYGPSGFPTSKLLKTSFENVFSNI